MAQKNTYRFPPEVQAELLSNPYTFRVTESRIFFTLAFKQFFIEHLDKPGMTPRKIFELAGYNSHLFKRAFIHNYSENLRREAASPEGLKEPKMPRTNNNSKKAHLKTEVTELQKRVELLEQQLAFLKKSQYARETGRLPLPSSSDSYTKP